MVKRQADKQLTDRIRALPKKSGTSTQVSPAPSKFGTVPSLSANSKSVATLFGQASQSTNPTPSFNLFGGSTNFGAAKPTAFSSAPSAMLNPSNSAESYSTQALTTYYASLRGLNLCVLKAFDGLITKDAFMDLSSAFDHVKKTYAQHHQEIEAELERSQPSAIGKTKTSTTDQPNTSATDKTNKSATSEALVQSPFAFAATEAPKEALMNSASSLATNGAQNEAPVKFPFSFPSNTAQNTSSNGSSLSTATETCTSSSPFSASTFGTKESLTGGSGFQRPAVPEPKMQPSSKEVDDHSLSSTSSSTAPAASRPGAFTMAAPMRPSPLRYESKDSLAGSPTTKSSDVPARNATGLAPKTECSKPASSHSSSADTVSQQPKSHEENSTDRPSASFSFSDSKSKSASLFGTTGTSATGTSLFGSPSTSKPFSFASPSTQNPAAQSSSVGFGFGVGGAGNNSPFGSFGSPKAAQATPPKNGFNPVGFSFGSSPPTSSVLTKTPAPLTSETGSRTNNSSSTVDAQPKMDSSSVTAPETSDGTETETGLKVADTNKGEEEEETLFETTGRVYALLDKKQDDGKMQKNWVGWAVCSVKLNRHQKTKRCRMLARSQVNQSILINFFVRPDLKVENRGNSLEVLGFNPEGTQLQAYRIRPSSIPVVEEFIKAIKDVAGSLPES
ncbi:hypothetical protein VP01_2372g4 [Puccinia sorghi]|uniref:RanBD1 domain-containing protein n=1 Tax=Puccinia sorghi TaxID=27349 RepID=A0A0L6V732_9BASI|nr:hypothetical protein VP01_2372g4 [Puccinia sorghi]